MHGDDLLYRFFQEVLPRDEELFQRVPALLLESMAIWLPLDIYKRTPILLPWVVRDPSCRGNPSKGRPDEWSSPNAEGYLRDDNSLIKSLPRSLTVHGPSTSHMHGARMGSEFVASHVWRKVQHAELASRIPILNSFVPNLVWLPAQIAKLTDREGGIVQQTLQAMSRSMYQSVPVRRGVVDVVGEAWDLLASPTVEVPNLEQDNLNWFESTDGFFARRASRLSAVVAALETLEAGGVLSAKVITSRYTEGLPAVAAENRHALLTNLRRLREDSTDAADVRAQ